MGAGGFKDSIRRLEAVAMNPTNCRNDDFLMQFSEINWSRIENALASMSVSEYVFPGSSPKKARSSGNVYLFTSNSMSSMTTTMTLCN